MKKILLAALTIFFLTQINAQYKSFNLMPVPKNVNSTGGQLHMDSSLSVSVDADIKDQKLFAEVNHVFQALNRRTGLFFSQKFIGKKDKKTDGTIRIKVDKPAEMTIGVDESYDITIDGNAVSLHAATSIGALRGLETILQLLQKDENGFYFPQLRIDDAPRFAWRGMMVDVARHFIPLDVMMRNIDAMAAVKMNVLHLHLTDDEGFRIESKTYPKLHQLGSNGHYYTQAQMKDLIAYAASKGIIIVPEFDLPGHSQSWFAGYPELASAPGPYEPGPRFKLERKPGESLNIAALLNAPTPTIDPTRETVYQFMDAFIKEMSALFPAPYLHIGADENNGAAWKNNPAIVGFMQKKGIKDVHALQEYFVGRMFQIVKKHGKSMIGWEEINTPSLSKEAIIQKWIPEGNPMMKSHGSPMQMAEQGNKVVVSAGFYTDLFLPADIHYLNPTLPQTDHPNILGGESAQWAEIVDRFTFETRVWPRTGAIAERLWSPASVNDVDDMYRRLFVLSRSLDDIGVQHISQYERSLRRLNGGADITSLKTLTDVLTPLKGYKNLFSRFNKPYASFLETAPLSSVSDIVFVDSEVKRKFRKTVEEYLDTKSGTAEKRVQDQLLIWQSNDENLNSLFSTSKSVQEIREHSLNLSRLAGIALEAIDIRKNGKSPGDEWIKEKMNVLQSAKKPVAETELAVIPEIEALIKGKLDPEPKVYPLF